MIEIRWTTLPGTNTELKVLQYRETLAYPSLSGGGWTDWKDVPTEAVEPPVVNIQPEPQEGPMPPILYSHSAARSLRASTARAIAAELGYYPPAKARTEMFGDDLLSEILAEVSRAMQKFPTWPTDPLHALEVLRDEFGELTKDVLELAYEPRVNTRENVRAEALQTAAMALRFAASLSNYKYMPGDQHAQEQSLIWAGGTK